MIYYTKILIEALFLLAKCYKLTDQYLRNIQMTDYSSVIESNIEEKI